MKLSICTPVMSCMEETREFWDCLIKNTTDKENIELVVVNNASVDNTLEVLEKEIFPHFPQHKLINNPSNFGVTKSLQQLYEASTGDVIMFVHNDLMIYEENWNTRVMVEFEKDDKLGLAGFAGSKGINANGIRLDFMSNLRDAEHHGRRMTGIEDGIIFDGQCLIARRAMMEQVGGFDQDYSYHHFYDEDLSLASYFGGWHNKIIGVPIWHKGVTAGSQAYKNDADVKMGTTGNTGDSMIHAKSSERFFNKWRDRLPVCL
jgi:glycosyltransferase involved in cell wall biosynthesis